jgi:hypothetical protein
VIAFFQPLIAWIAEFSREEWTPANESCTV